MSWAEIKKAVNSNINTPLNEQLANINTNLNTNLSVSKLMRNAIPSYAYTTGRTIAAGTKLTLVDIDQPCFLYCCKMAGASVPRGSTVKVNIELGDHKDGGLFTNVGTYSNTTSWSIFYYPVQNVGASGNNGNSMTYPESFSTGSSAYGEFIRNALQVAPDVYRGENMERNFNSSSTVSITVGSPLIAPFYCDHIKIEIEETGRTTAITSGAFNICYILP